MEIRATFYVKGCDDEFIVTFDYTPFQSAKVDGPLESCYPEEGGEVEINSVTLLVRDQRGGKEIESGELLDVLHPKVLEELKDKAETWAREAQSSGEL